MYTREGNTKPIQTSAIQANNIGAERRFSPLQRRRKAAEEQVFVILVRHARMRCERFEALTGGNSESCRPEREFVKNGNLHIHSFPPETEICLYIGTSVPSVSPWREGLKSPPFPHSKTKQKIFRQPPSMKRGTFPLSHFPLRIYRERG